MRIPDYPAPDRTLDGTESLPIWEGGQQRAIPLQLLWSLAAAQNPAFKGGSAGWPLSPVTRVGLANMASPIDRQVAYLSETGYGGIFVFSTANLSSQVAADLLVDAGGRDYIAPVTDTTGASGAWVRAIDADLLATTGAAKIGAVNGAGKPTTPQKHIVRNYIEEVSGFVEGSGGDPVANSNAIAADVASLTKPYDSKRGALYKIARSIQFPSNTGIVCEAGTKPIIYLPAANFTNASNASGSRYGSNAVGINVSGMQSGAFTPCSNGIIENIIIQSEPAIGRWLRGIVGRNITGWRFYGIEIFGIPTGVGLCLSSAFAKIHDLYIHDFFDSTVWGSAAQSTGYEQDGDLVNGVTSDVQLDRFRIENITGSGTAFIPPGSGMQTDAVNVVNMDSILRASNGRIYNVGEGIDHFGKNSKFDNIWMDLLYNYGLKLIHGASYNNVTNLTVLRYGLAGVIFDGSTVVTRNTEMNSVNGLVVRDGDPNNLWPGSNKACVRFNNNGGTTYKPFRNKVTGATLDEGANGTHGWLDESSGTDNYGDDILMKTGAANIARIFVLSGGGSVRLAGTTTYQTSLV